MSKSRAHWTGAAPSNEILGKGDTWISMQNTNMLKWMREEQQIIQAYCTDREEKLRQLGAWDSHSSEIKLFLKLDKTLYGMAQTLISETSHTDRISFQVATTLKDIQRLYKKNEYAIILAGVDQSIKFIRDVNSIKTDIETYKNLASTSNPLADQFLTKALLEITEAHKQFTDIQQQATTKKISLSREQQKELTKLNDTLSSFQREHEILMLARKAKGKPATETSGHTDKKLTKDYLESKSGKITYELLQLRDQFLKAPDDAATFKKLSASLAKQPEWEKALQQLEIQLAALRSKSSPSNWGQAIKIEESINRLQGLLDTVQKTKTIPEISESLKRVEEAKQKEYGGGKIRYSGR